MTTAGGTSVWHREQAAQHRRQSERAAWLHDQEAAARRLALALWAGNDLDLEETSAPVLTEHARAAFDVALTRGLLIAAVCALTGAFVGWRALGTGTAASTTGASSAGNGTGTAVPQPAPTPAD